MDRIPALAGARTSLGELSVRPTPRGASATGRGRLTLVLVLLGVVTLAGSVAVASLSLHAQSSASNAAAAPPGKTERRAVAVAYVDVEGGIRSLYPGQAGRVVALPVPEGGAAEEGAVLLQLDDALAKLRLKEAELDLEGAKEKLRQAKDLPRKYVKQVEMQKEAVQAAINQQAIAQTKLNRVKDLFDKKLHNPEDVEVAREGVEAAKAAVRAEKVKQELAELMDAEGPIRAAEIEVRSKEEQVRKAELAVRECRIVAPCKGKVIRRLVHVGEMLGATPSRPAVEFCPDGDLIVRAEVEQEFANKLAPKMTVTITDDVTNQGSWKGQVTRISEWFTQRRAVILEPMQYNDVRTLEVIIKVKPDPSQPLRINQRVRVKLEGEK